MKRVSLFRFGCGLALLLGASQGHCADRIAEKLDKAKLAFQEDTKKTQAEAKKYFQELEDKARDKGDKAQVDKLKEEWKAFTELGVLPESLSAALKTKITTQRDRLEAAYTTAAKEYSQARRDDLATAVEQEWDIRHKKGLLSDPNPAAHRLTAGLLRPHAELELQFSFGATRSLKKTDPLPDQAYVVTHITFDRAERLPLDFVDSTLMPALVENRSLVQLAGYPALALTDDQLTHLADLSAAKTLTTLGARFDLTLRALIDLKRFPNLADLTCAATTTDDAALAKLGDIPRLHTLHLDRLGQSGAVSKKGMEGLTSLPLTHLEVQKAPALDREFIRRLPSMPKLRNVDFSGSPISDDDLMVLARCQRLHRIVIGGGPEPLTDKGLAHLSRCASLTELHITSPEVTDAGLEEIAKIRTLQTLGLQGTQVTEAGLKKLSGRSALTIILNGKTVEAKKK